MKPHHQDPSDDPGTDARELEEMLAAPAQTEVRNVVARLAEDVPSLVWRGRLNARLESALLETARRRRPARRFWLVASPALGLAAACCVALLVVPRHAGPSVAVRPPVAAVRAGALEDDLFSAHMDDDTSQDVVGPGLSSAEVQSRSEADSAGDEDQSS